MDELERTQAVIEVLAALGSDEPALRELVRLHVDTVVAAVAVDAPDLVAHQARWERTRLQTLGLDLDPDEVRRVLRARLEPWLPGVRLREVYDRADRLEPALPRVHRGALDGAATRYLAAALAGRQDEAVGVVRRALRASGSVAEVVATLLQPVQREVGRLWEAGEVDVAQEHAVTAVTQVCLGMLSTRLGARLTAPPAVGRTLLAATVGGEGHDVGLRVLTTLVAERGWQVEHLGGGVPVEGLVAHVARSRPDVLALSVTIFGHVTEVRDLVDRLRQGESTRHTRVLVGGRAFSLSPDLSRQVGADGFASDATTALELFESWFGDDEPVETFVEVDLADRYGFEDHHREGALAMLAEETGLSVDDLRRGLSRVRR